MTLTLYVRTVLLFIVIVLCSCCCWAGTDCCHAMHHCKLLFLFHCCFCCAYRTKNVWACAHILDNNFLDFCDEMAISNDVNIYPLEADFNSTESVKDMAREILKAKLPIHGLVNIAGITKDAIFQMTSSDDIRNIHNVNVVSTLVLTQAICTKMIRDRLGSIVNIS